MIAAVVAIALAAAALGVAAGDDGDSTEADSHDDGDAAGDPVGGQRSAFSPRIETIDPFDVFGGAVQPDAVLNVTEQEATGLPETSGSWSQAGPEVTGHARIVFESVADPGIGWWALGCLPVAPLNAPRVIGDGFLVDVGEDRAEKHDVLLVLDPVYDPAKPVVFLRSDLDGGPVDFTRDEVLVSGDRPLTWGDGDILNVSFQYEAAPEQPDDGC